MSRILPPTTRTPRSDRVFGVVTRSRRSVWSEAMLVWVFALVLTALPAFGSQPVRIAVAPFAGESPGVDLAQVLTHRLAERPIARLIAPDAFVAYPEFEPRAAEVRQWAYNAAVDTVVVGRVSVVPGASGADALQLEAALRSGHSGAEFARHVVPLSEWPAVDASVEALAATILEELGYTEGESRTGTPIRDPRSPEPPLLSPGDASRAAAAGGDDDPGIGFAPLQEDEPIEIEADEAEIIDRDEKRRLVFQRNVSVRQGDVTLESERLEAEYRKGESEPDRLIARGSVHVGQGHRQARCDQAIYMRVEQRLSCEGRAELVQGCDVVRGDSIEFDFAGERARVKGAASIVIRPGKGPENSCSAAEDSL